MRRSEIISPRQHTDQDCNVSIAAVQDALYVLNGKWRLPVVVAIGTGHKHFGGIQKALKGIASKVLTRELRHLELNGLIKRNVLENGVHTTEYSLTHYSATLKEVIASLSMWGKEHRQQIKQTMQTSS